MNVKIDKNRFSMGSFQYGKYPLVNGGFGYGVRVPESVRERIWNFS